jgi:hypothetical protein
MTDTLDSRVTFASASDGGSPGAGVVSWTVGVITPNYTITRTLWVTVDNLTADATLNNSAEISSAEGDTASDAITTFVNVPPNISVSKMATPTSVLESGGIVTFTVVVTNNSAESVTLNSLIDSEFGDLSGQGNCLQSPTPTLNASGDTYSCSFTQTISGNYSGPAHQNTITATVSDNESSTAEAESTATVTFINEPSSIEVSKTANPTAVNEPGGTVNYTVSVTNTSSVDQVTIDSVTDDVFGNIGIGSCSGLLGSLSAGQSRNCNFSEPVSGQPSTPHTNTVTIDGIDDDGEDVSGSDSATVTFNNVGPTFIIVDVNASPSTVLESGALVNFTVRIFNNSAVDSVTIDSLTDTILGDLNGQGTCLLPQTIPTNPGAYLCTFSAFVAGDYPIPVTEVVSASGQDDDNSPVSDDGEKTISLSDAQPDISVSKTANPSSVPESGGNVTFTVLVTNNINEAVTLDSLTDDEFGDLDGEGDCVTGGIVPANGSYNCSFQWSISGNFGNDQQSDVTAEVSDDESNTDQASDGATVNFTDVLPDIDINVTASPSTVEDPGENVTFTIEVTNNSSEDNILDALTRNGAEDLDGKGDCVANGSTTIPANDTYSCSFTEMVSGSFGDPPAQNTIRADASDNDGNSDNAQDDAPVSFGQQVIYNVFLPIVIKPQMTELYVYNDGTGGNVTFIVRELSTNAEVTRCTVGNNQTIPCDHDSDGSNIFLPGTYKVEVTAVCGSDSFEKTYAGGYQETRVFCN